MNTHSKVAISFLVSIMTLFFLTLTASADVIDVPDPADNIPQVNAGNVLTDYTQSKLNALDNPTLKGNMDRKYIERQLDENSPTTTDTYAATPDSSDQINFQTEFYLPDGFNVSNYQHGNFQSVTLDDAGNVYFIESNGSDTNLGVIIKYNLAELNKLGVGTDTMVLWKAFNYYNPNTDEGVQHNQQYEDVYEQLKTPTSELKTIQKQQTTLENHLKQLKVKKSAAQSKTIRTQIQKKIAAARQTDSQLENQAAKDQTAITTIKKQNADLLKYAAIAQAAQLSPQVDIGHGQTLTFNPQNNHLYIVEDNTLTDLKNRDQDNTVLEMTTSNLKPIRQYNFKMFHGSSANLQLHTLAFDKNGNAYWGRKTGMGYMFFYGRLDQHDVQFQAAPTYFKNRGGSPNQGVSINAAKDRIYFVSDDILTSVPTQQVRDGSFTSGDIHYDAFTSKREFESLTFDQQGFGYLMALWPAELMKSSAPMD